MMTGQVLGQLVLVMMTMMVGPSGGRTPWTCCKVCVCWGAIMTGWAFGLADLAMLMGWLCAQ